MIGRTATAWVEFADALRIAKRDSRVDREDFAREHLDGLEPRLSRLRIVVPERTVFPSLAITRDGITIGKAAWNEALPVDPGPHVVEAGGPGKVPSREEVAVDRPGETVAVTIQPLADLPTAGPSPETVAARRQRAFGIGIGAAGVVAVGVGTIFGLRALDLSKQAKAGCPSRAQCAPDAELKNDDAKQAADTSTVLVISGVAVAGVGVVLWLLAPASPGGDGRRAMDRAVLRW